MLFTEYENMQVILFDEHESIANKLGNIIREKCSNVEICTSVVRFLESASNKHNVMNVIFLLSVDVLEYHNIKIGCILKKFDCYTPIITYNITDNIHLNLDINYIYEHQEVNFKTFIRDVHNIESCFRKFANNEEYFLSHNLNCVESPVYLSSNKKNQIPHNLYAVSNAQEKSDIISCLTKMQSKLFVFLISHKEGVSLNDISYNLWGDADKSKAQCVYTLIHGLNHIISQKTSDEYKIIHQKKKYQLIQITKTSTTNNLHNASVTGNLNGCSIIE